jgi:hypothetical protein
MFFMRLLATRYCISEKTAEDKLKQKMVRANRCVSGKNDTNL